MVVKVLLTKLHFVQILCSIKAKIFLRFIRLNEVSHAVLLRQALFYISPWREDNKNALMCGDWKEGDFVWKKYLKGFILVSV